MLNLCNMQNTSKLTIKIRPVQFCHDARTCYVSELSSANQHNSKFLFKTVDQFDNTVSPCVSVDCDADCEKVLIALCWRGGVKTDLVLLPILPF